MIDTIVLKLEREQVRSVDMESSGIKWDLQSRTNVYDKYVRNPSPSDLASGLYFPKLTGYHRKGKGIEWGKTIRIELSLPKLIYNNNFDELTDRDFELVAKTLQERLEKVGLVVSINQLLNAPITTVHYSKNILLKEYTAQFVSRELGKINLNKRFDFSRARFSNDGECLYAYTKAHSIVFYDKIADLKKPEKRRIDRENSPYQLGLFEPLHDKHEVLRYEVRLCEKRKINSIFKQLGFSENPTFQDVYSLEKSLKVINLYWSEIIEEGGMGLFSVDLEPKKLLEQIYITSPPKIKGKQAIYLAGLLLTGKDRNGLRELRAILTKNGTDARSWYRMLDDYKKLSKQLTKLKPRDWFDEIKKQITDYKPLKIKELLSTGKRLPVNNSKV